MKLNKTQQSLIHQITAADQLVDAGVLRQVAHDEYDELNRSTTYALALPKTSV